MRVRFPGALHEMRVGPMSSLRAALPLMFVAITAILPANDAVKEAAELLRQAALKAGCVDPRLSMRSLGNGTLEVEVWCADGGPNGR